MGYNRISDDTRGPVRIDPVDLLERSKGAEHQEGACRQVDTEKPHPTRPRSYPTSSGMAGL